MTRSSFSTPEFSDRASQDISKLHIPPHNIEAEQACLGACLIDAEALDRISEMISGPDDFYREAHGEIYSAMVYLAEANNNIDLITVCNRLRDLNKLDFVGGATYLDSMVSVVGSSAHALSYAKIVSEAATERRLQQAGQQIQRLAGEGEIEVSEKVDKAEELVFSVADRRKSQQLLHVKPILETTFDELYERFQRKEEITGIPTGFRDLDAMTAGFQKSNLIILAARPSMGKTAFVLSMAQNIILNKKRPATVAMFSLEMAATSTTCPFLPTDFTSAKRITFMSLSLSFRTECRLCQDCRRPAEIRPRNRNRHRRSRNHRRRRNCIRFRWKRLRAPGPADDYRRRRRHRPDRDQASAFHQPQPRRPYACCRLGPHSYGFAIGLLRLPISPCGETHYRFLPGDARPQLE